MEWKQTWHRWTSVLVPVAFEALWYLSLQQVLAHPEHNTTLLPNICPSWACSIGEWKTQPPSGQTDLKARRGTQSWTRSVSFPKFMKHLSYFCISLGLFTSYFPLLEKEVKIPILLWKHIQWQSYFHIGLVQYRTQILSTETIEGSPMPHPLPL